MNWKKLAAQEMNRYWDLVYDRWTFNPHEKIPLQNPQSITFSTADFFGEGCTQALIDDLNASTINMLQHFDQVIALDWQHEGYVFYPHLPFELDEFDDWYVPAFPNGDLTFFLIKNLENGIFADGINNSITYFGEKMIEAFQLHTPLMFQPHSQS